jgi:glycosyltransferase involved in cell wall biosynthesis
MEAYWHKWRRSYEGVDLFLTPSLFFKELASLRMPGHKIKHLRNGIKIERYIPKQGDDGYILYFGRISREKGIETLLRAHAMLSVQMPLKIVGTGPSENSLRLKFPQAEFLGFRGGTTLRETIANCAFVVVPSEWFENCPMTVLEAMASGKPVIGSAIGGIPEQIDDGKTGLLFEAGNVSALRQKMTILARDPDLRKKMGQAARRELEREFSLQKHCQQLVEIYRSL